MRALRISASGLALSIIVNCTPATPRVDAAVAPVAREQNNGSLFEVELPPNSRMGCDQDAIVAWSEGLGRGGDLHEIDLHSHEDRRVERTRGAVAAMTRHHGRIVTMEVDARLMDLEETGVSLPAAMRVYPGARTLPLPEQLELGATPSVLLAFDQELALLRRSGDVNELLTIEPSAVRHRRVPGDVTSMFRIGERAVTTGTTTVETFDVRTQIEVGMGDIAPLAVELARRQIPTSRFARIGSDACYIVTDTFEIECMNLVSGRRRDPYPNHSFKGAANLTACGSFFVAANTERLWILAVAAENDAKDQE